MLDRETEEKGGRGGGVTKDRRRGDRGGGGWRLRRKDSSLFRLCKTEDTQGGFLRFFSLSRALSSDMDAPPPFLFTSCSAAPAHPDLRPHLFQAICTDHCLRNSSKYPHSARHHRHLERTRRPRGRKTAHEGEPALLADNLLTKQAEVFSTFAGLARLLP